MAVDTDLGTFLANREGDREPLLSFKWVCEEMPGLNRTYVETVGIPWVKIAIKDGWFGSGTYTYFPGFTDIDAFDIQFYEDSMASVQHWVTDWMSQIKNFKVGYYYLPANYKKNMTFVLLNTEGHKVLTVKLIDVWPSSRNNWDLNYDQGNKLTVSVNFSCDDQQLIWHKGNGGQWPQQ